MNGAKFPLKPVQIVNIVTLLAVVLVNILSNAIPFNGVTAGEISARLPSFFTPAGYTFSVWLLIYAALLGFILYQALPGQRERPFLRQIGWLFAASGAANIAWLFLWHYGYYAASPFLMLALLLTLIAIYIRLDIGRPDPTLSWQDRLLIHLPFSLYLAWVTVAMIANTASVLAYLGWNGFGIAAPTWSAVMMLVAAAVTGLLLFNRRNLAYAAVVVWALFGIRAAFPNVPTVANTAWIAAALVAALALTGYWRTRLALRRPQAPGQAAPT